MEDCMEKKTQDCEAPMVYCHQCGAENPADADVCVCCGAQKDLTGQIGGMNGPTIVMRETSAQGAAAHRVRGSVFVPPSTGSPKQPPVQVQPLLGKPGRSMPYVVPIRSEAGSSTVSMPYVVPVRADEEPEE